MPAVGLPILSYVDDWTTPSGLSNISFGAGANPDALPAFTPLLKNDASTAETVATRAHTSRTSSPIFDPGNATTLDFQPSPDPDPTDPTRGTARTALITPEDETDTLTVPSRVGTTISGAAPGRPKPAHCGRSSRINPGNLDGSVQLRPGHRRLRRSISHHRHRAIHGSQLLRHGNSSHHHQAVPGEKV